MTKTVNEDDPRLKFVPIEVATVPPSGLINHLEDRWWIVHPSKGIVYWIGHDRRSMAAQCNSSKKIAKSIVKIYPWAEVCFLPSVFHKISPRDYC